MKEADTKEHYQILIDGAIKHFQAIPSNIGDPDERSVVAWQTFHNISTLKTQANGHIKPVATEQVMNLINGRKHNRFGVITAVLELQRSAFTTKSLAVGLQPEQAVQFGMMIHEMIQDVKGRVQDNRVIPFTF